MKYEIDEQLLRATIAYMESQPIRDAVMIWDKLKQLKPIEENTKDSKCPKKPQPQP